LRDTGAEEGRSKSSTFGAHEHMTRPELCVGSRVEIGGSKKGTIELFSPSRRQFWVVLDSISKREKSKYNGSFI
jgi:hypothetical protein